MGTYWKVRVGSVELSGRELLAVLPKFWILFPRLTVSVGIRAEEEVLMTAERLNGYD